MNRNLRPDGDRLATALAAALADHGITDPAATQATAQAAEQTLGRDRCTHDRGIHAQHHHTPVDHCPWCATSSPADRHPQPAADAVLTGSLL